MLKIAIIGCGKVADQHATKIATTPDSCIVAVCDREQLMADQLADRLGLQEAFTDVGDLLARAKPDVAHITTPPQTHYPIAKQCLDAGCHIYVEKPFSMNFKEAEAVLELAERKRLKVTVGHDAQFSHAANRMRQLVAQGYLGGLPVHMESYYCYNLGDANYAKALLGDPYHWVRNLPGGLLQNTISHGISKVAEFMTGSSPHVIARGFTSDFLKSIGERKILDELRVIIEDAGTTAYFTFSSQMRPSLHMLRLYGPKNGLIMDESQQTVIKMRGARHKSFLEQFLPPWNYAKQYASNGLGNVNKFLKADFQDEYGKKYLIRSFYQSIIKNEAPPIPYDQILRTSRIIDEILSQISPDRSSTLGYSERVLV